MCKKSFSTDSKKRFCKVCALKVDASIEKETKAETVVKQKGPEPKLSYSFELFTINYKTLNKFMFLENRRRLSHQQITVLRKLLFEGKHFDSPIVINILDGLYRIIDGNHRLEAIKGVIKKHSRYSIQVLLIKYKNVDLDGEIAAFRRWNIGKVQTMDDFIQSISKEVPIIKWFKKDFSIPINIYKKSDSIGVKLLCNSYIASKKGDDMGHGMQRENFANELYDLDGEDYDYMNSFCKNFSQVFGMPNPKSRYYRFAFFFAVTYITMEYEEKSDIWKLLRERVLGNQEVLELAEFTNREANRKMIGLVKELLRLNPKLTLPR